MTPDSIHQCARSLTVGPFTICENIYPADGVQTRHAHDKGSMTLMLAGSLREQVNKREVHARPLSMVVKPVGTEHANRFGGRGAHTLQLRIDDDAATDGVLRDWRWDHCNFAVRDFLAVLRLLRADDRPAAEIAAYDLLSTVGESPMRTPGSPRWLLDVCAHIDDLLPGSVRVDDVARAASVHPVYLARQFRRFFNSSVTGYIAAGRAQHAAQLLCDTPSRLADAALRAGYSDQSHMTRALRAATGLTPRALQRLLTGQV